MKPLAFATLALSLAALAGGARAQSTIAMAPSVTALSPQALSAQDTVITAGNLASHPELQAATPQKSGHAIEGDLKVQEVIASNTPQKRQADRPEDPAAATDTDQMRRLHQMQMRLQ